MNSFSYMAALKLVMPWNLMLNTNSLLLYNDNHFILTMTLTFAPTNETMYPHDLLISFQKMQLLISKPNSCWLIWNIYIYTRKCATCVLNVCYMCITCVLHVYYMCDTCVLHVWYMCITCLIHVYYMYDTCVLHVWYMCITCLIHVYYMCDICVIHMYYMCDTCVLHVWYICITCVIHVYYMCDTCVLHVWYMCITCVLHVCCMCDWNSELRTQTIVYSTLKLQWFQK